MWLPGSANERKLNQLRDLIAVPTRMRPVFDRIYDEESSIDDSTNRISS